MSILDKIKEFFFNKPDEGSQKEIKKKHATRKKKAQGLIKKAKKK
tara:strand:- start:633 stop:767 length:135 start_codon:yes stop_codon:yes gene_type:complete